jgi:Na+/melibiose symporter-like transporter
VLVTAGLVALVFGITQASDYGWGSGETIGIFLASAALLVGFLVWEVRAAEPLMPMWIFRIRTVAGANVAGLTLGTAVFAMFLMLTLYMQQVLTYSPMQTGVAYLAVAGTAIIWSFVASTLVTRIGVKPVLVTGMAMLTAGLVYFTQVSVDGSYAADLLPGFLLIAVGLGFSFVSISIAALAGVRHSEAGLASGLLNTSQQVGGALGVAVLATVATSRTDTATADGSALAVALTDGFEAAFIVGAAIAFAGVLVGLFAVRREDLAQPEAEDGLVLEPALELDEAA